ncbi:hypothetical protein EZJ49_08450 [Bdellovibrio bacteriovorus]|uniref:hypothetical protein n=1 Tax=Bdellovibrio bacteriovorus TaxID=959 RepID=UPI0021D34A50|nr:hypothetical protein [Bdellovibrio bacteriovorus]UXR63105.1 hypothetical protein EZJ49_08450 [Bdellovibrio bacteriovorus]
MKKILLLLLTMGLVTHTAYAQEETDETTEESTPATETATKKPARSRSLQNWGVSLSTLQWNETLRVQDGINMSRQPANYNAITVTLMKEITYYRWGWSAGVFIGSGRANGGVPGEGYLQDKVAFTTYGVSPRGFYRFSGRINAGVTLMGMYKNIDWPRETSTQIVDAGRNLYVAGLLDLNIRLFRKWDFYSGLGPLKEGDTLWKVGVNYRF